MSMHHIPLIDSVGPIMGHDLSAGVLSGGRWQSPYEQSAIQNFPIGTRLRIGDRVFYYCKAAGTTTVSMKAGHNSLLGADVNTAAVEYAAGTTEIVVLDTDTRAANYYENGYIWIMGATVFQLIKIKSSAAAAADDDQVTLQLWDPITTTVPASTFTSVRPNPFSAITFTTTGKRSMMCVPLIPVTTAYYFWGQTWGPCYGTAKSAIPGTTDGDRDVYFNTDGAIIAGTDTVLETVVPQRAGFVITDTTTGGDQFYMLQITP